MSLSTLASCRRCGCPEMVHDHYRVGTDCGRCGKHACPSYKSTLPWHIAEPNREDPLGAARGIACGLLIALVMWALLFLIVPHLV